MRFPVPRILREGYKAVVVVPLCHQKNRNLVGLYKALSHKAFRDFRGAKLDSRTLAEIRTSIAGTLDRLQGVEDLYFDPLRDTWVWFERGVLQEFSPICSTKS